MDETLFPDAPETPAPIFAYRALKGFIFGSPDPDRDESPNKENKTRGPQTQTRNSQGEKLEDVATTPKRKRGGALEAAASSPVKSILRPSGMGAGMTPRAKQLQMRGTGVTFKDVRKASASPEARRGTGRGPVLGSMERTTKSLEEQLKAIRPVKVDVVDSSNASDEFKMVGRRKDAKADAKVGPSTAIPPLPTAVRTDAGSSADLAAYMRSAEKEMKKLVRYGQKMREYAGKQDEENSKLKQALEQLRRENERLKKAGEASEKSASEQMAVRSETLDAATRKINGEVVRQRVSEFDSQSSRQREESRKEKMPEGNGDESMCGPLRKMARDVEGEPGGPLVRQGDERKSSVRLPPARIAAARERIRLRVEKRKASEMSEMDWADV